MAEAPLSLRYSESLTKYIMEYHRSHTNSLKLACVVSTGSGEHMVTQLAAYFSHVHLHIAPAYPDKPLPSDRMADARKVVSDHFAEHWEQARFSLSKGEFHEIAYSFAGRSVDLVVFDDCVHQSLNTGSPGTSYAMAHAIEMLTPNGCVVFTRLDFDCFPLIYRQSSRVVYPNIDQLVQRFRQAKQEAQRLSGTKPSKRELRPQLISGLDFVDVAPDHFYENVTKRVSINGNAIGDPVWESLREWKPDVGGEAQRLPHKRRDQERLIEIRDDPKFREFRRKIDRAGMERKLKLDLKLNWSDLKGVKSDLDWLFEQDDVEALWKPALVLATRNMKEFDAAQKS